MTVPISVQENIRTLDSHGISRAVKSPAGSVLTGFEDTIELWLGENQRRPRKQRHTVQRVFDRLVAKQDYLGSYSPEQRFVSSALVLGYLDSNQEQMIQTEPPESAATLPQVPRDFAEVGEHSFTIPTSSYGLKRTVSGISGGFWHPKWHRVQHGR